MARKLFRGTVPQVFATDDVDDPDRRRIFVWAWTKWFERIEGTSGNVDFTPVADTETELRKWLAQEHAGELSEVSEDFAKIVRDEFVEQSPLYPEAPELSVEEPFREQRPTEDIEHY